MREVRASDRHNPPRGPLHREWRAATLVPMTVEVVSSPPDLATWDPSQMKFYFELLGETSPVLDTSHRELATTNGASPPRIYEYSWTIGHPGISQHRGEAMAEAVSPRQRRGGFRHVRDRDDHTQAFADLPGVWGRLEDPAAHIYIYFPTSGNWRVKEVGTTVKYLTPLPNDDGFLDRAAKDLQLMQPLFAGVSSLANAAAPGSGSVVSGSAHVLEAMAQMKVNSIPQSAGFPWSVATAVLRVRNAGGQGRGDGDGEPSAAGGDDGQKGGEPTSQQSTCEVMAGVAWSLPKSMFEELGGRLSGGLAVVFEPVAVQSGKRVSEEDPEPEPRHVLAHAAVHADRSYWAPAQSEAGDRAGRTTNDEDLLPAPRNPRDFIQLLVHPTSGPCHAATA